MSIPGGWYVVRAYPHRELWVATNVLVQHPDAQVYLPMLAVVARVKRATPEIRARALFPGYLFVKTVGQQWRFLLGTFGVRGLPMFGEEPGMLSDREVLKMKAREDQSGHVVLPMFRNGQAVRARKGVFAGQSGVVVGMTAQQRCRVLMDVLGRKTSVLIAVADLEGFQD